MIIFNVLKGLINEEIEKGNTKFIIFPYGKAGEIARTILDATPDTTYLLVDNRKAEKDICSFDVISDKNYEEYKILLCCINEYYPELKLQLEKQAVLPQRIIDLHAACFSNTCNIKRQWGEVEPLALFEPRLGMLERCAREIHYRGVNGNCAEAGVFRGAFAKYINFWFPDRKLYLADTFEGFPREDVYIEQIKQYSDGSEDWSKTNIRDVLKKMPFPDQCIVKKGRFPDSMQDVDDRFAYVSLDMDLYQPILAGLEYFYPKLSVGGYIMVHDCGFEGYPGSRAAVEEYCKKQGIGYVICSDVGGTAVITK